LSRATSAQSKRYNMPLEGNIQTDPAPRFTECVSEGPKELDSNPMQIARRLQELVDRIETQAVPSTRALLAECLESLLALYGDGLKRILDHLQDIQPGGPEVLERLIEDRFVSGLLLVHGLHPVPLEARLRGALDKVRPYLQSHGGNLELLSLENQIARIKLLGSCKMCPSSTITLELAVRKAVEEACPDLMGFETEKGLQEGT